MDSSNMALYMKNRRANRRAVLIKMAGGKCASCGATEKLDLNHIDRSKKKLSLSGVGLDGPWAAILKEMKNCNALCRPCHIVFTRKQIANGEMPPVWNKGQYDLIPIVHGTARAYTIRGCRCDDCKWAKRLYRGKELSYLEVAPDTTPIVVDESNIVRGG